MEYEKPRGTICDGSVKTLTIIVEVIRSILRKKEVVGNKTFSKKGYPSTDQNILHSFSCIIEHQKSKTKSYKGSQGVFVFIV